MRTGCVIRYSASGREPIFVRMNSSASGSLGGEGVCATLFASSVSMLRSSVVILLCPSGGHSVRRVRAQHGSGVLGSLVLPSLKTCQIRLTHDSVGVE